MEILLELIDHTRFLVLVFLFGWMICKKENRDIHKGYFLASSIMLILELAILGITTYIQ